MKKTFFFIAKSRNNIFSSLPNNAAISYSSELKAWLVFVESKNLIGATKKLNEIIKKQKMEVIPLEADYAVIRDIIEKVRTLNRSKLLVSNILNENIDLKLIKKDLNEKIQRNISWNNKYNKLMQLLDKKNVDKKIVLEKIYKFGLLPQTKKAK